MKNESNELTENEAENIVMFPASRFFQQSPSLQDLLDNDPLEELLNEFSDVEDDFEEDEFEDSFDLSTDDFNAIFSCRENELSKFSKEIGEDSINAYENFCKQVKAIEEAQQRMKFFLDELQLFIPKK